MSDFEIVAGSEMLTVDTDENGVEIALVGTSDSETDVVSSLLTIDTFEFGSLCG